MPGPLGKSCGHISHSQLPLPSIEVGDCYYSGLWFEYVSRSPLVPTAMVLAGQEDTYREGPHTLDFGIPSLYNYGLNTSLLFISEPIWMLC